MTQIIGSRGTGKTKKLIEAAVANNGIIVSANPQAMDSRAIRYGIIGLRSSISFDEFIERIAKGIMVNEKYYIDELEVFLKSAQVAGFTLVNDEDIE